MLKRYMILLDRFLPSDFIEHAEAPLLYRARIIVATSFISLTAAVTCVVAFYLLHMSFAVQIGVIGCVLTMLGHICTLKSKKSNYTYFLNIGATLQIVVISLLIYMTAFSEKGMGFFGLIWLIPFFQMMAFYFTTRHSFYLALASYLVLALVSYLQFDQFMRPLQMLGNFQIIFLVFLMLVIVFSFMLSFLFVHLSEELQREVAKQRDLLIESAKFQSLGKMATNLAHDINNPLFTIQGKLHQMRNLLSRDQLDLEKCDQIVESVEATLLKLSQIVKGISTFAREGRGDQMVSVSVEELIESNIALAMDRMKNSGIELDMSIDPKAKIICYPSFISQVLLNLLNNAIDALETAEVKKIEVSVYCEKNWVYICVIDTGPGVPKEFEQKIFEPFFTTKTLGKGTGLGLSISKGLVEVHEGELLYERKEGRTIFKMKLPSYE